MLNKLNNTTFATYFDSFDFSTLYINIPHDLLVECLKSLVEEAYRVRGANYISIGYSKAYWTDKTELGRTCISEHKVLDHIRFFIDNIYINVGNKVFKRNTNGYRLYSVTS